MKPDFSNFASIAEFYFQPTPGQVYADLAGELAILDSKTGVYYGLDPVGARIWSLLLEWKTAGEVRAILLEEYEVDAGQVQSDMLHLFGDLFTKKLIDIAPASAKPAITPVEEAVPDLR